MQTIHNKVMMTLIITVMSVHTVHGQSGSDPIVKSGYQHEKHRYAMLIRNMNHLNAAIKTVRMLNNDEQKTVAHFEVVVCGREVQNLQEHRKRICRAREHHIRIKACGMSMKKFGVSESSLPPGVDVVPNGLIRLFELQEEGYMTITL